MPNTEWLNEWKSDFFRNFTDEVDKENDYYDSQFEEGRPSRVWDFIEGLLAHHRELIVKEMEEKLWIPCCHTSGMHDPVHFQNKKYICGDQVQVALHRFCTEMGINPKTKSDPNCSWCQQYPEKKNGEGLGLIKK